MAAGVACVCVCVCSLLLPISPSKAGGSDDRCIGWCESEIRLVVLLFARRSPFGHLCSLQYTEHAVSIQSNCTIASI